MITILVDHDIEGQAALLWSTFIDEGWPIDLPMQMVRFIDIDLAITSTDRIVWRFVQAQQMFLLTGNRNMDGDDSLEQTIRDENHVGALPIFTVGRVDRMAERQYRIECVNRIIEVLLDLDNFRGVGRVFIP